jgi:hypothetical protein
MATGKASDFKIYHEQINGGLVETLVQQTNAFNAASRGAIRMVDNRIRGDYEYESFFQNISGLVSRRDTTSVSAATDAALTQDEMISVKLNRKIGPVANTLDSFRKIMRQADDEALSFLIGTMVAKAMAVDKLNTAVRAARAALDNQADNTTLKATIMATEHLVDGLALMGDAADRVVVWVMHSKPYFDLVKDQIAANIDGISNFNVANAAPVTLNRPVLVTDSEALRIDGSPTGDYQYFTLGLVPGAIEVENSEEEMIHAEIVTGLENLVIRMQGEFAYNLGLKGFQWDVGNGGANPTDSTLGTGSNWDKVMASAKDLAGVVIETK